MADAGYPRKLTGPAATILAPGLDVVRVVRAAVGPGDSHIRGRRPPIVVI